MSRKSRFTPKSALYPNAELVNYEKLLGQYGLNDFWRKLDEFRMRAMPGYKKQGLWPGSVFVPDWIFMDFIDEYRKGPGKSGYQPDWNTHCFHVKLGEIATWRPSQHIVKYDNDFCEALRETDMDEINASILDFLPAWSVYFDKQDMEFAGYKFKGFFARQDICQDARILRITFVAPEIWVYVNIPFADAPLLQILKNLPLTENPGPDIEYRRADDPGFLQALNMVIYLCNEGFPGAGRPNVGHIRYPQPTKVKTTMRIIPPDKPKIHLMGKMHGDQIRSLKIRTYSPARPPSGTTCCKGRKPMRPHIRRAHWHGFWVGAHGSPERRLVMKWLPPCHVGGLPEKERV